MDEKIAIAPGLLAAVEVLDTLAEYQMVPGPTVLDPVMGMRKSLYARQATKMVQKESHIYYNRKKGSHNIWGINE